ncbi:MAG: hypothetical protein WBD87_05135 [Candidatus Acidiferrales bacterium]
MVKPVTTDEMHVWLKDYMRSRPDIGLGKAIVSLVLHPRNPFDSGARRKPRAWFLLSMIFLVAAVICFYYFNFAG